MTGWCVITPLALAHFLTASVFPAAVMQHIDPCYLIKAAKQAAACEIICLHRVSALLRVAVATHTRLGREAMSTFYVQDGPSPARFPLNHRKLCFAYRDTLVRALRLTSASNSLASVSLWC